MCDFFFFHGALLSCQYVYVPVASGQCRLFSFVWLSGRVSTTGSSSHLQSYRSPNGFLSSSFWPRCLGDYQLLGVLVVFKSAKMCFSPTWWTVADDTLDVLADVSRGIIGGDEKHVWHWIAKILWESIFSSLNHSVLCPKINKKNYILWS